LKKKVSISYSELKPKHFRRKELTMVAVDTFITILYVMVDDFCQSQQPTERQRPGPQRPCSEVIMLALFGQWAQFPSERAFYRYTERHLRSAFPTLPDRSQFNRLQREYAPLITAFGLFVVKVLDAQHCWYERIDSSEVATRDACAAWGRVAGPLTPTESLF
jgi:hypothetical protein